MTSLLDRFLAQVHELLQAGYASLSQKELEHLNSKHEPDITAALAMQIQRLIDDGAVLGITRSWQVVENLPVNLSHLPLTKQPRAKKRKLPDLTFRFGGQRQALYFRFESKALAGSGDFHYLLSHEEGLGRFLRRLYGRDDIAGGMLGYVLIETPEIHAERVGKALTENPKKYRVRNLGGWTAAAWKRGPACSFRMDHTREGGSTIILFYSFLHFPGKERGQAASRKPSQ